MAIVNKSEIFGGRMNDSVSDCKRVHEYPVLLTDNVKVDSLSIIPILLILGFPVIHTQPA